MVRVSAGVTGDADRRDVPQRELLYDIKEVAISGAKEEERVNQQRQA